MKYHTQSSCSRFYWCNSTFVVCYCVHLLLSVELVAATCFILMQTILTEDELENFKPHKVLLRRGHANFHNSMTIHGSYGNK